MSTQKTAEEIALDLAKKITDWLIAESEYEYEVGDCRGISNIILPALNRAEQEAERLRKALEKLTSEASGFLAMADVATHGITNINVLLVRISEARAVLTPQPTEAQEER